MSIANLIAQLGETAEPAPAPLTEEQRAYMLMVTTDEERREVQERRKVAALEEYQASEDGQLEVYREGQAPEGLKVKAAGLSPARAAYVRFAAWVDATRQELADMEAARSRAMDALGAPKVLVEDLEKLKEADKSGMLAWILGGALGKLPDVHAFRRAQLEEKLAQSSHEAEIARHGLAEIDSRIHLLTLAVDALENRRDSFVRAVLVEAAQPLVAEYDAAIEKVEELAARLAGIFGRRFEIDQAVPAFGGSRARMTVSLATIADAARSWEAHAEKLRADPRAILEV